MQMNLLRKVSLLEFRAASSSDAVKPTPSARIGFGRAGACAEGRSPEGRSPEATAKPTARARAGHRRTTRLESSVRNLGGLAGMHRRAELEGNLRRKPNPKGAQADARKRSEESDEAMVAGKLGNARGCEGPLRVKGST